MPGSKKVVFDRAHADPESPAADALVRPDAAGAQRQSLCVGATYDVDRALQQSEAILPAPQFRDKAQLAVMIGKGGPFLLSSAFPTNAEVLGRDVQSISACTCELSWQTIDMVSARLLPSMFDTIAETDNVIVLPILKRDRFDRADSEKAKRCLNNHSAALSIMNPDFFSTSRMSPGKVPGGSTFFHVMGAHYALKTRYTGWILSCGFPAMLIAALAIMSAGMVRDRVSA